MTKEAVLARLNDIQTHEGDLLMTLTGLREERSRLLQELAESHPQEPSAPEIPPTLEVLHSSSSKRSVSPPPLPLGRPIPPERLKRLREEIDGMSPDAFQTQGRDFIRKWYPKLCKTPAWHELSSALQRRFGAKRQQVAGVAASIVRKDGASMAAMH